LFTSDELVKKLIENEVFEQFLDFLLREFINIKEKPDKFDPYRIKIMIHHLENLVSKPIICQFLCKKLIFFDKFFEILACINHIVFFDKEDTKNRSKIEEQFDFIDLELNLFEIILEIVKSAIKTMENSFRNAFLDYLICSLMKKMRVEESYYDYPSFHIILQRVFSLLISMKLYYNRELFERKALENYLFMMNFASFELFKDFIIRQFMLMANFFVFLKEIEKNLWNDYSNLLSIYPKIHQIGKLSFFNLDFSLFQLLIHLLSQEKTNILLDNYLAKNPKIIVFFKEIMGKTEENLVFDKENIDFLEELLNILLMSTSSIKLSFVNNWNFLDSVPEIEKIKEKTIEKILETVLIQHNSLDLKAIKKKVSVFLSDSFILEGRLEKIAIFDKKNKSFKLKNENIHNIDPFLFIKDSTILFETFENLQQKFKENELLNINSSNIPDFLSEISDNCLLLISHDFFDILISILSHSKSLLNHSIFVKKILKILSEILTFFSKEKLLKKLTISNEKLRNSLLFLKESNLFPTIRLSIDKILEKLDEIGLESSPNPLKTEKSISSDDQKSKKEHFLQKQKELKKKFLIQQEKFILKNQEFLEEEFETSHHQMVCVICKEEIGENSGFGQCAYFNRSNIYKYAVFQQISSLALEETDKDFYQFYNEMELNCDFFKEIDDHYAFSSCFHYLHMGCYQNFMKTSKKKHYLLDIFEYNCPLCHRLANIFIPGSQFLKEFDVKALKNMKKSEEFKENFIEKINKKSNEKSNEKIHKKINKKMKKKSNGKIIEILNENLSIFSKFEKLSGKECEKKNSSDKISGFFDEVMKLQCFSEETHDDSMMEILENAIISVVLSLPVLGFNYFLNKQLVVHRNLLYLYKLYWSDFYESPTKKEFLEKRKNSIENLRDFFIKIQGNKTLLSQNIEKNLIEYAILSFIYYDWQPEEFFLHISHLFNISCFFKALQCLFRRNYMNPAFKLTKEILLGVFKEKNFIRVSLNYTKTILAILLLIYNFEQTDLRELNIKTFISDEEELNYLNSMINLMNLQNFSLENELLQRYYPLLEELFTNSFTYYQSLVDEKHKFLFIFEAKRIEKDVYFKLYELEPKFSDLMGLFSKRKCDLCHEFSKIGELCLCLICGVTICNRMCKQTQQIKGNLNIHAIEKHCGCSVFINMQNSEIFFVASPMNHAQKSLIYSDKYGQNIKLKSADWGSFVVNNEEYDCIKEIVLKNCISQEICYRSLKDNTFFKPNVF